MSTIAMFPEPGAWGPTNNLVAIAEPLRERGHRVVFVVEESFAGELVQRDFEEALMRMAPAPENPESVGEGWAEFIRTTAPEFRKPTIEQLATVTKPIWEELVAGAKYAHARLREIWEDVRPDVVVSDNVVGFPAVPLAGVPWVRMVSSNPLELDDPVLPPAFSGYPADDQTAWTQFRDEYARLHEPLALELSDFNREQGAPPLAPGQFQYASPWLNLFLFAAEIDYARSQPLGPTWHRLDSTVRSGEPEFDLDQRLPGPAGAGRIVYLSLGSLGCMDTGLMQRFIDVLRRTEHRVIVSLGPRHEELVLGERMYGEPFLPQTSIVPACDLVITHGGNNTVGEALYFGLPMIVHPLFWDQYDNAQRVDELGYGVRLRSYDWTDAELLRAVERLLGSEGPREPMGEIAHRLQRGPGQVKAADLIEQLCRTREPVSRPE
ncbi:MAG: glycosyltransferase [Solirubrobacteraceae bacterium]